MNKESTSFHRWLLLTGARIVGIVFSLAIPMYLGRTQSVETYGTYKQIMLIFWFSQVALNLGMDDSAYYYLRLNPRKFPLYSLNAFGFNLLFSALLWLGLTVFKTDIAGLVKNPELSQYLPLLGYVLLATVSSMQIEGILIGMDHFNERLILEIATELLKSLGIMAGFLIFNSIYAVLVLLAILMTIKLVMTLGIIFYYMKKESLKWLESRAFIKQQLHFGLPLGLSRILQNVLNIENFFISSFFNLSQFTYYSVGCFENPIINAARGSMYELANIEMVDAVKEDGKKAATLVWKAMTRKLFFIIIPMVVFMIFFSREIIVFIFSEKYLPSVPFFMVFNLYLIVGALNPEPFFRSTNKTHFALNLKMAGVVLGLGLFFLGAYWGGALWALAGKIVGVFIMNISGLVLGARLADSSIKELFAWKELLASFAISSITALILRLVFSDLTWHPFWILSAGFSIFIVVHILFLYFCRLLKEEEILLLKRLKGFAVW